MSIQEIIDEYESNINDINLNINELSYNGKLEDLQSIDLLPYYKCMDKNMFEGLVSRLNANLDSVIISSIRDSPTEYVKCIEYIRDIIPRGSRERPEYITDNMHTRITDSCTFPGYLQNNMNTLQSLFNELDGSLDIPLISISVKSFDQLSRILHDTSDKEILIMYNDIVELYKDKSLLSWYTGLVSDVVQSYEYLRTESILVILIRLYRYGLIGHLRTCTEIEYLYEMYISIIMI